MADNGELVIPITANVNGLDAGLSKGAAKIQEFSGKVVASQQSVEKSFSNTAAGGVLLGNIYLKIGVMLKDLAMSGLNYAKELDSISDATGVTATKLNEMYKSAERAGVETEGLSQMLLKLSANIGAAQQGSEEMQVKFEKLGISMKDLKGLKPEEQFRLVANAITQLGDRTEQTKNITEMFGKAGAKNLEFLKAYASEAGTADAAIGSIGDKIQIASNNIDQFGRNSDKAKHAIKEISTIGWGQLADLANVLFDAGESLLTFTDETGKVQPVIKKTGIEISDAAEALKLERIATKEAAAANDEYIKTLDGMTKSAHSAADAIIEKQKATAGKMGGGNSEIIEAEEIANKLEQLEGTKEQEDINRAKAKQARLAASLNVEMNLYIDNKKAILDALTAYDDVGLKEYEKVFNAQLKIAKDMRRAEDDLGKDHVLSDAMHGLAITEAEKAQEKIRLEIKKTANDAYLTLLDAQMKAKQAKIDADIAAEKAYQMSYITDKRAAQKELKKLNDEEKYFVEAQMAEQELQQAKFNKSASLRHQQHIDDLLNQKKIAQEQELDLKTDGELRRGAAIAKKRAEFAQQDAEEHDHGLVLWEAGERGKLQLAGEFLDSMSGLMESNNKQMFAVGKAAAIANAIISTYEGAQKAYTSLAGIPIVGPALGAAAAAASIVAGIARVQKIQSTQMGGGSGGGGGGSGGGSIGSSNIGGPAQQNNSNVNVTLYGDAFSAKQVQGLVGLINSKAVDNNMTLHTQVSSGYSS